MQALKDKGYKLVSLTNSSNKGVYTQFKDADLLSYFDERLSVEDINLYKPDTRTYEWAIEKNGHSSRRRYVSRGSWLGYCWR
ncbi:hypothetical protein ALT785_840055 [Alteromonas infernus]